MVVTTTDGKPAHVRFQGRMTQPNYLDSAVKEIREAAEEKLRKEQKRESSIFWKTVVFFRKN